MNKHIKTTASMNKTKTGLALLAAVLMACAGVVAPTAAHANHGTMCLNLGAGLNHDPVTSGQLQVVGMRKLYQRGERRFDHMPKGVAITIVPAVGMTLADLERAAACQAGSKDAQSPLGVEGAKVSVTRDGATYVLNITSNSRSTALEIQRRAAAVNR